MSKSIIAQYKNKITGVAATNFYIFAALMISIFLVCGDTNAQVKLKKNVPELCYECHKDLEKKLSDQYTHFLFRDGKCTACHNSHVSNIEGLMQDEVNLICLGCHDRMRKLIRNADSHGAVRDGTCTDCHQAHSGSVEHLLITEEKTLCLNCHENIKDQSVKPYACAPFREGNCSSCHDSHASVEDNLLVSGPGKLCQECHKPRCSVNDVSIASKVKDTDCTSCHSGHSSVEKGLLGPYGHSDFLAKKCEECHEPVKPDGKITTRLEGKDLCFSCHEPDKSKYIYIEDDIHVKNKKRPCNICHDYHASGNKNLTKDESGMCIECHEKTERRTVAMNKALGGIKCSPVKERKCFECHIPTHLDSPLNYRADALELCARCHESQHKITHPLGEKVIDPRNGEPVTCISCHSMHAARAEFMLTFDGKRALCIQCHKM